MAEVIIKASITEGDEILIGLDATEQKIKIDFKRAQLVEEGKK
jgi:hypothetical protein